MDQVTSQHALSRFGLGRMLGEPLPVDPMRWVLAQLEHPDEVLPGVSIADAFTAINEDRADRAQDTSMRVHRAQDIYHAEMGSLVDRALIVPSAFRERLVWFWANHFTVSLKRGEIAPVLGDYVRNAIRPHVTGHFGDMLLAVMRHPAMLFYLDNAASVGPTSVAGRRGGKGINENLARECLELHTITPASGYTQDDVTSFARLLTGWSVETKEPPMGFRFRPNVHEPGIKQVMHQSFAEGEQGGVDALAWLAVHPSTHRNLATKLVRHFVSDNPPPAIVRRIESVLKDTRGDLGAATRAIVGLHEAWQPLTKLRSPQDYVLAVLRAAGLPSDRKTDVPSVLASLGQPLFTAPFPIGWPDRAEDWIGPEAIMRRIDWAYSVSGRSELPDPESMADTALGPLAASATVTEMRRAGSRRDALTILIASPEMQRR